MNEYQADDFLVADDEVEEDGYNRQIMNPDAPEAVIESELGSSDLDVMDDEEDKPKKRMKKRRLNVDDMYDLEEDGRRTKEFGDDDQDSDGFIVKNDQPRRERVTRKTKAHDIFNTDMIDIQPEILNKPKINKIYTREEIEEQYATEKDLKIKVSDIPERILKNFTDE